MHLHRAKNLLENKEQQERNKGMNTADTQQNDNTVYKVVINHEEQYSIWPFDKKNPLGWRDGGRNGTKAECLEYIKEVWTDMRPLSLRKKWNKWLNNY